MKFKIFVLILIIGCLTCITEFLSADPGEIDERGGHYDQKTGEYHLHRRVVPPQPPGGASDVRALAITQAHQDALIHAERDSSTWYGAGFLFGVLGMGAAYVTPPIVPGANLLGKSPEYIIFYTDAYKEAIRAQRLQQAMTGCVLSGSIAVLYYLYRAGEL